MRFYAAAAITIAGVLFHFQGLGAQGQEGDIRQLLMVDRSGAVVRTLGPRMNSILDPALSPDGSKVAVRGRPNWGDTDHLWIIEGSHAHRLTSNVGSERHMLWSPSGTRIAYSIQNPGGMSNLYVRPSDGSGVDRSVVVSEEMHKWYPSWSPDASILVFHTNDPATQARDLWYVDVASGETGVLVDDDGIQALNRMSRDGNFVAYQSDHEDQLEVYVTTWPRSGARWKVSISGGTWPKWSHDELFYWAGNTLMAVPYTASADGSFQMGTPTMVFTAAEVGMGANNLMTSYNPEYDVNAEGTRFLVVQHLEDH